ncbi:MAG: hypothetical protein IT260_13010 [Saprospiraceae bacterium]|nr:hypothetical protein [Saprospiraceae bacterium]
MKKNLNCIPNRLPLLLLLPLQLLLLPATRAQSQSPLWIAKWDASALIDVIAPVASYSLEYRPQPHFSIELGFGIPMYYSLDDFRLNYRYHRWRLEARRVVPKSSRFSFFYGAEAVLAPRRYAYKNSNYNDRDNINYSYDFARVKHTTTVWSGKWGGALQFGDRFVFEFFTGAGFRLSHLKYYDVLNPNSNGTTFDPQGEPYFELDIIQEGWHAFLHFSTGIKLGVLLNAPNPDKPEKEHR